jgi:hypothetical protein
MTTDLESKLKAVCDESSFIAFLGALANDRADEIRKEKISPSSPYTSGPNGWENIGIDTFLESAAAWASDFRDSPRYEVPSNIWKRCAEIIYAGKSYE